jgi:hypothetical protein
VYLGSDANYAVVVQGIYFLKQNCTYKRVKVSPISVKSKMGIISWLFQLSPGWVGAKETGSLQKKSLPPPEVVSDLLQTANFFF